MDRGNILADLFFLPVPPAELLQPGNSFHIKPAADGLSRHSSRNGIGRNIPGHHSTGYFAYSDAEKAKICRDLDAAKTKYALQRSKGLGENEAEMMWLTTMNPETRRLIRVTPADVEETARMFDLLLGDNLQGRKDYIAENGSMYLELADIS